MTAHPVPPPFPPLSIPPTPNPLSLLSISPPPPPEQPRSTSDPAPPPCPNPVPTSDLPPPPCPVSDAVPPLAPSSSSFPPLNNPRSASDLVQPKASSSILPPPPPPPPLPHRSSTSLHTTRLPHHQRPNQPIEPKGVNPPPQQLSYAQAAKSSRGPSFVRAHANEVESFAKIPRTGVNIICGSREGVPSFSFVSSELPRVEDLYSNALIMKFHGGRPSLESSHKEILSWGIEHPFSIGPLTSRAFLLRFQNNTDLLKVLTRPSSMLITFPYKVFRWHNLCHLKEDSCLAPVWISLPRLPLQCFIPEFLEAVGNKIGRFLCFDKATTTLARPSAARMCVELDLRKSPPQSIWVGLFEGFKQPIVYERMPKFCNECHVLGHYSAACSKKCPEPIPPTSENQVPLPPGRTQPVRQNAPWPSSANQQEKSPLNGRQSSWPSHCASEHPPHQPSTSKANHPSPQPETQHYSTESAQQTLPQLSNLSTIPPTLPGEGQSELALVLPTTPHKPTLNSRHTKGKQKRKSVSFGMKSTQQQSNLVANHNFWDAVNRQVAILEQARLKQPMNSTSSLSHAPPLHTPEDPAPPKILETPHIAQSSEDSSGSSIAADSQPNSPHATIQEAQNPTNAFTSNQPGTYDSEGEEPPAEPSGIEGHDTDEAPTKRPHSSKRNKRHPDQPLKVQLRVRKDPNTTSLC